MTKSLHIRPAGGPDLVPIPVTFYLSPEMLEDEASVPAGHLADLLRGDLVYAINFYREQRRLAFDEGER